MKYISRWSLIKIGRGGGSSPFELRKHSKIKERNHQKTTRSASTTPYQVAGPGIGRACWFGEKEDLEKRVVS